MGKYTSGNARPENGLCQVISGGRAGSEEETPVSVSCCARIYIRSTGFRSGYTRCKCTVHRPSLRSRDAPALPGYY
eukprot:6467262-Pyramimonas_sp.AAC.1